MYSAHSGRYDTMPYRRVGRSGLKLPALSLGLWHNFGSDRTLDTQREILRCAFDLGVTHFDLANNYGPPPGEAERVFGRLFAEDFARHRDEVVVSTKAGYLMWPGPYGEWGSRKYLLASLDQSLRRTGLDHVDIFYSHRYDPDTPLEETMGALHSAVQQGKALYAGISNYPAEQTRTAATILRELGTPLLIHQPRYSMLDRAPEDGVLDALREVGAGAVAYSPLAQGLLTDRYLNGVPEGSRAAGTSPFLTADAVTAPLVARLRSLNELAAERGQSLAQLALAWTLRDETVASAIVGASSARQLRDSVEAAGRLKFGEDELLRIEAILAED
ncbi:L-glyceraldehyde 3-phosphate reductase [Streptomyces albidochromogenes]|uniref:aldo/keto reductase n=1 Tax=Streptomyces albidochromogenes TaxID=329524 RepID=UPI00110F816E|nr:aldo/keto reductase [Streptomyces albidochromogenes]